MTITAGIPKADFTMLSREHAGTRMGLLQQRYTTHLLYALTLLKSAGTLALMLYALLWEAGNLVDLPDKRIGFYNFCLWNETAGWLQCLEYEHLQMMGISLPGIVTARVCVYACLVFSIFYPIFVAHVKCTEETEGWKVIIVILIIKTIILSGGLGIFLFQTTQWIQPSDFTGGFLALLGSQALLLLQILTATMYLSWAKHTPHVKPLLLRRSCPLSLAVKKMQDARAIDNLI
uniref:Transmembrane protein 140 n=1 Tax=Bubo bubo TaxID=30461 RepID=A0A8C0IB15_BUBBB